MSKFFNFEIDSLFEEFAGLQFRQHGPLYHPIKKQSIRYLPNGKIELTTISNGSANADSVEHKAGTIRVNDDKAVLESLGGTVIELRGIQPFSNTRQRNYVTELDEITEISSVHELWCKFNDQSVDDFQIEYVSNVESGYIFSDSFSISHTKTDVIKLGNGESEFSIEESNNNKSLSRSAVFLDIDGIKLYLISLNKNKGDNKINDAVIVYLTPQALEVRNKIRDCIAFGLGKQIHYHGYVILNSDNRYVELSCKANYSKVKKDSYHALMPTPLGQAHLELGHLEMNRLVKSMYENYEKYNLKHVLWGYWHALDAPVHMAGVHFGACIEAFQSAYVNQHSQDFPKKLIQKSEWKTFRERTLEVANALDIPEQERSILINKINNLNQTPQSVISERFFEKLGIELSVLEKSAWKERNNAAHGKGADSNGFEVQIRNIKILKCLLHRMLLISTKASEYYFDYYSIGFPIRYLSDSIVEEIA
ncbi:hypothetical protein [Vibrio parahaemolyticus]|uniref:hypothetical protein n=1 Tax=Vibrio parahaemolyticus TaxID=670 RepID=UPI00111F6B69|nr:hypothetical protein [Vibrio parahaemolyticus]EGQ7769610.1 hypothetical protein [Vibrio parahaemolyticus]EIO5099425.1 hypothetical protein [Vibrio parahaemolyticus]EIV8670626.1 hypothetical protein [Vibrio parahaemolyticus]MDF4490114.1 hypothetical protein [Vibrio parahaemolyticus]MDG3384631.1 hypothetical protein [Vibrio parahaemolyticus]